MAESAFRGVITFFEEIGLFDVVLPFLLVFVIVFAILEKTRIFGTEEVQGQKYSKKNLNAVAAFVIAFFVIASARLVEILQIVSSQVVILLVAVIFFLLLIGTFYKEGEGVFLEGGWKIFFMVLVFIGIVLIFMNALGWLDSFWGFLSRGSGGNAVGSIILLIIIILFMVYIVKEPKSFTPEHNKSGSSPPINKGP